MSWYDVFLPKKIRAELSGEKKGVPEGVWTKCGGCSEVLYRAELERCQGVCPQCSHHHRLSARQRLTQFFDEGELIEIAEDVLPQDFLKFRDSKKYKDRLNAARKKTGEKEALIVQQGELYGMPLVAAAFEFSFMGGSMGSAVGERFVQGVERALELRCPFICFSASGGARMQEGLFSLMQMAKTAAALERFSREGLPFISVLTDPTMGGVSASFAMLGDIIVAEPRTMVGFAGPRVIEQTVRQTLPEGFQRSEFLLEHGAIDCIIDRRQMRLRLARLLAKLQGKPAITDNV